MLLLLLPLPVAVRMPAVVLRWWANIMLAGMKSSYRHASLEGRKAERTRPVPLRTGFPVPLLSEGVGGGGGEALEGVREGVDAAVCGVGGYCHRIGRW